MDGRRFDAFSRMLGKAGSRRGALRTITAGALGSGAVVVSANRAIARNPLSMLLQDADLEEQSVLMYEALADLVSKHAGMCSEIAADVQAFQKENEEALNQILDHEGSWSREAALAHNEKYADRLDAATATVQFAQVRCKTRDASLAEATPCGATAGTGVARHRTAQLPSAQNGCDCNANCPMGVGWCIYAAGDCLAGADCECCWTSYCGSRDHCMTDCEANECCTGGEQCATPDHP